MKKIIFKNKDNSIGIITPTDEALTFAMVEQIAEKDVPSPYDFPVKWGEDEEGDDIALEYETYHTPYWIVDASVIPTDRTFRDAWEIDDAFGVPDGFGGESDEFTDEQLLSFHKLSLAKLGDTGDKN